MPRMKKKEFSLSRIPYDSIEIQWIFTAPRWLICWMQPMHSAHCTHCCLHSLVCFDKESAPLRSCFSSGKTSKQMLSINVLRVIGLNDWVVKCPKTNTNVFPPSIFQTHTHIRLNSQYLFSESLNKKILCFCLFLCVCSVHQSIQINNWKFKSSASSFFASPPLSLAVRACLIPCENYFTLFESYQL